jgi:hypothetical protein
MCEVGYTDSWRIIEEEFSIRKKIMGVRLLHVCHYEI